MAEEGIAMAKNKGKKQAEPTGEFAGRHKFRAMKSIYQELNVVITNILNWPLVKGATSREEFVRAYALATHSKDHARLPYYSSGIGTPDKNRMRALGAELSCLLDALWAYEREQTAPNLETLRDSFDYLDQLTRDSSTIVVEDIGRCRYRLTNDRITNDERMVEG